MFVKVNFEAKSKTAIIEFICESITTLTNVPTKDLDNGFNNFHYDLANIDAARYYVHLNSTTCILLYSICLNFLHRINCSTPSEHTIFSILISNNIKGVYDY